MRRLSAATALVAALLAGGCELDVQNPNDPDAARAFADPAGLEQLMGGAFRTWVGTRGGYFTSLPMTTMADNYTASWNNAAIRYYSSVGQDGCPSRCGWTNSATAAEAAGGLAVNEHWYGYYTVLSSANDVVRAIDAGLCFDDDCDADDTQTARNKAIAKMLQGMALAGLALSYDKAFIVDETTDLTNPAAIEFSPREDMRDAALDKFDQAYQEADGGSWKTDPTLTTDADWAGVGSGRAYTRQQILQLIRTMQAELIAMFPRNAAENAQADWASVATFASQGISSGTAFDWEYYIDVSGRADSDTPLDWVKIWGNAISTMRVDTRVAAILTTNHRHPWPDPGGNPCPTISSDRRVGDGTYGPSDNFNGQSTKAATANAGTDYACSGVAPFPPARGQYHQSNLVHKRYQHLTYQGDGLPTSDGTGQDPFYTRHMNDLLWAEGLIRSTGGSKALAAQLINKSRVTRGGLPPLSGSESTAELLAALQYEQEIEFMGQGPTPFFNRRRIDGLQAGTPRHMPVPAKELDVLVREVYTFGGPGMPDMSVIGGGPGGAGGERRVRSVGEIWKNLLALRRAEASRLF
jgi:hypothetical protein